MSRRWRFVEVLCACVAGAGTVGALSTACNAVSGIGDFGVGGAEAGGTITMDGTSDGRVDSPQTPQDAMASSDGGPNDGSSQPEATDGSSQPHPDAGVDAGDARPDGNGGGPEGGPGDAGDAGTDAQEAGTGPCDGGTALVVHSNGLGDTFTDCTPLATFNLTQAFEACAAHTGDAGACSVDPITCSQGDQVCGTIASVCTCWRYNGNSSGRYSQGSSCNCVGSASPQWN
jgi:hypothetical protein